MASSRIFALPVASTTISNPCTHNQSTFRGLGEVGWYIWIISFDLFPLFLGGFAIEEDVRVSGIQFLRKFHFDPGVGSKRDVASSIEFK